MRNKKLSFVLEFFTLFLVVTVFASCNKLEESSQTSTSAFNTEDSKKTSQTIAFNTEYFTEISQTSQAIDPEKIFSYELKNEYASRADILDEDEALRKAYLEFCDSKEYSLLSEEEKKSSRDEEDRLIDYLRKLADEKYPLSKEEKEAELEEAFYSGFAQRKEEVDYYFTRNKTGSTDDEDYKRTVSLYEKTLKIKENYESGKITIEEAFEQSNELHY